MGTAFSNKNTQQTNLKQPVIPVQTQVYIMDFLYIPIKSNVMLVKYTWKDLGWVAGIMKEMASEAIFFENWGLFPEMFISL